MRRASPHERRIAAAVALGILGLYAGLWLLQEVGFDFGLIFPPCGFRMRTGLTCPTCGMTHAVLAFARGHVLTAFFLQPAAGLLCSLMIATAFFTFLIAVSGVYFCFLERLFAEVRIVHGLIALFLILAGGWVVTLARAMAGRT